MTPLDPQEIMLAAIQVMMNLRTELIITNMLLMVLVVLEVCKIVVPWLRRLLRIE